MVSIMNIVKQVTDPVYYEHISGHIVASSSDPDKTWYWGLGDGYLQAHDFSRW